MDRLISFVKIFNVVAGIVLVLGVIVIGWTIVQRNASNATAPAEIDLALPAGGRIIEMVPTADRVVFLIELNDERQQILILDPLRPSVPTTVRLTDERP